MSDDKRVLTSQSPFWCDKGQDEEEGEREDGERMESATVDKLLQGETLLSDLHPRKSKGIRIYVSCPSNELVEERKQYAENVYSHLYDYCWNNYGVECMITDLKLDQTKNWELPENIELCQEEIRRCRQTYTGPSLLIICQESSSEDVACHLLSTLEQSFKLCYKESETNKNCIDDVDNSSSSSGNANSSSDEDLDCDSYFQWIFLHNQQTEKQLSTFYNTGFGIEIRDGLVMCRDQPLNKQNIIFTTNAAQIEKKIAKKVKYESKILKRKNADPTNMERIERYSQGLNCKFVHLPKESGICIAKYHCIQNGGLCGKDAYMSRNLERHIDSCLNACESIPESNGMAASDILNHWYFAKQLTQNGVCRDDINLIFENYLYVKTTWPLAVIGEEASGKSTLIALLALSVQQRLQQQIWKDTYVVLHFLGLTPQSSHVRDILFSICSQIIHLTGRNSREVPRDYTELKTFFKDLMQKGPLGASVVILLDNIECFHCQKNEELYEWLPLTLAENVKIIFTSNETLESFCVRANDKVSRCFEIGSFSRKESRLFLESWIKTTNPSYNLINTSLQAIINCNKPGIQKILLESIKRFKSIPPGDFQNVQTAFDQYLLHLEEEHNKSFVSNSLGLLAMAMPMGLSEMELEILLKSILCSVSDSNRNNCSKANEDIVYRWRCLHKDINWFLAECIIDEISVLTLPLGHLSNRIKQRYLTNCDQLQKIEDTLYRFYNFSFDEQPMNKLQPLYFPIAQKWNIRKFNMAAHVLARRRYYEEYKTRLLYDYNWLVRKLRATSLENVLNDFSVCKEDTEAGLILEALQMSRCELQNQADFLCFELLGRLLPVRSRFPNIRQLLDQCDQAILKQYYIAPMSQLYIAPGGPLKKAQYQSIKHANVEVMVDMFQTGAGIFAMYRNGLESATGLEVRNLEGDLVWEEPHMPSKKVLLSRDGKYMNVFLSKDFLAIIQSRNGNIHGVVETGLHQTVGQCSVCSEHYIAFTSVKGVGPILIDIENCTIFHRMEYYIQAMAFSKDEGHFVIYTGNRIMLFSIPCFERKGTVKTEEVPMQLMLSPDGKKCFSLSRTGVVAVSHFDWTRRDSSIQEIFYHVHLQLMTLSAKGEIILFMSSKKLFLCKVQSPNTVTCLEFPVEIFIEKISYFVGAAFSATDDFVIGLRWTYVGIWETRTSTIVRVLKTSDDSPFKKLFVPKSGFEFYTLTNHKLELWDLQLIQSDVQFRPNVFSGAVKDLALSANGQRVICCTYKSPEAKVLDVRTGTVLFCLLHGHWSLNEVTHVEISPDAQFAVTFSNRNFFDSGDGNAYHFLKECILWDIRKQNPKKLHHFGSCRFVTFPKTSDLLFVIYCHSRNNKRNIYSLMVSDPEGRQENYIKLPQNIEFLQKPCVITSESSDDKNTFIAAIVLQETSPNLAPVPFSSTTLFIMALGTPEESLSKTNVKNLEHISIQQIYPEAQTIDKFYDIKTTQDEKVLLIIAKNIPEYNSHLENCQEFSNTNKKMAAIFDVVTKETLILIQDLSLTDHIEIPDYFFSQDIFKNIQNIVLPTSLTDSEIRLKQYLVTDGCRSVGLSDDQKYLHLVSLTKKKNEAIHVPIHGRAVQVDVAGDGRTLAVGCTDGRILLFSLTFNSPQRSNKVLTRVERTEAEIPVPKTLLELDISRADAERQNQICLSAKFRKEKLEEFYRPQSSKKLLANAQSFNEFRLLC